MLICKTLHLRRYFNRAIDSDDDMEADADTVWREEMRRCVLPLLSDHCTTLMAIPTYQFTALVKVAKMIGEKKSSCADTRKKRLLGRNANYRLRATGRVELCHPSPPSSIV